MGERAREAVGRNERAGVEEEEEGGGGGKSRMDVNTMKIICPLSQGDLSPCTLLTGRSDQAFLPLGSESELL